MAESAETDPDHERLLFGSHADIRPDICNDTDLHSEGSETERYDIGNALLYTAGKLLWLTLGIHGSIVLFALALRARKMYENTAVGSEGKTDDRHARNTLIWSAVLLTVIVLRQAFRYCYPLGTP